MDIFILIAVCKHPEEFEKLSKETTATSQRDSSRAFTLKLGWEFNKFTELDSGPSL